jgi:hypothetical protein
LATSHATVACWECVPLARILMDGTGGTGVSAGAAERAWRPSPSPLAPFLSRAAGEEGGMVGSYLRPCFLSFRHGARKGDGRAAPFAVVSCRFSTGRGRGDGRAAPFAVVSCRKRKGEGGGWRRRTLAPSRNGCVLGVRAAGPHPDGWNRGDRCQCQCCGAGLAALTFPPSPPSSPAPRGEEGGMVGPHLLPLSPVVSRRGEEGGMVGPHRSPLSPVVSRRGEEGGMVGPHRSPLSPAVSPRGEEGGMVGPHRSPLSPVASGRGKVGAGEEERWPLTQWVHGHGTFPIRNSGF